VFNLMPRDEAFYDFFERAAGNLRSAAQLLDHLMHHYSDIEDQAKQFHNVEHSGDRFTQEAVDRLDRTFITPFDRDDILVVVQLIDDVLDQMDEAVSRMVLYKVAQPTEEAKALAGLLVRATGTIHEIMPMLRKLKQPQVILNRCLEIHAIEAEADRIEQRALARLFESANPIEVIKWKDIYADLEAATDSCQRLSFVIQSIVVRHS